MIKHLYYYETFDGFQTVVASMIYNFLDKKSATTPANISGTHAGTRINTNSENQQLAEELQKSILKKFKKTYTLPLKTTYWVLI